MELLLLGLLPLLAFGLFGDNGGSDEPDEVPGDADSQIQRGDSGPSTVQGSAESDLVLAAGGADEISGGLESDLLVGEGGADTLLGDAGDDLLLGGAGDDSIDGGTDDDLLIGGSGDDDMRGGQGFDILIGSSGSDTMSGGDGFDLLVGLEPSEDLDLIAFLDLDPDSVAAELLAAFGPDLTADDVDRVVANIESGNSGDGSASASGDSDVLDGGNGNDTLIGDRGDIMTGGAGVDTFAVYAVDGAEVTSILDFDPAAETLTLLVDGAATGLLAFRNDAAEDGAEVLLDDEVVAYLEGVLASQILPGSVTLQSVSSSST